MFLFLSFTVIVDGKMAMFVQIFIFTLSFCFNVLCDATSKDMIEAVIDRCSEWRCRKAGSSEQTRITILFHKTCVGLT